MARFERGRPSAPERRGRRAPRLVLGGALLGAAAVGACALPAEYPVRLGQGLEIVVDAASWGQLDPEAIAQRLRERDDVDRIEVSVDHTVRIEQEAGVERTLEQVNMQLFVFGDALDDQLWPEIQAEFPALANAEIHEVPLSGTVRGTLGGRLSHELLDLTLDRHGVEQAEAQILAELVAAGIAPEHATIDIEDVTDDQGRRRIEVRVEAER